MTQHSHAGKPCTDPDCGFNDALRTLDRAAELIDELPEGAVPLVIKGYNDELEVIDQPTAFAYAVALSRYIGSKNDPMPDDALTMATDLLQYIRSREEGPEQPSDAHWHGTTQHQHREAPHVPHTHSGTLYGELPLSTDDVMEED